MIRSAWAFLGFRSAWDWLELLRQLTLMVTSVLIVVGLLAVNEKVPWIAWTAGLLLVAAVVRDGRPRRGSPSHLRLESHNAEESGIPAWIDDARRYCSEIGGEAGDPVSVFDASDSDAISDESPGTLCLRLEPRPHWLPWVRVLDADRREQGIIRSEGPVPGVRYAMRRNGELVWRISVRSIVRNRHTLELAHGDSWTFDTPFFWWQNLTGTASGTRGCSEASSSRRRWSGPCGSNPAGTRSTCSRPSRSCTGSTGAGER